MKQYNGKHACHICLDEGKSNPTSAMHTYYPFQEESSRRSHSSIIQAAKQAASSGVPVNIKSLNIYMKMS
jgi:hypothetical protein